MRLFNLGAIEQMGYFQKVFNIGVPSGMDPVEAKYIGMSNIGALFFILITPPYMLYCFFNNWLFLTCELLGFMGVVGITFIFNRKGHYTLGLIWFGSILNYHLVVLSVIFGWDVKIHYLIFFTAGGAIMLFRRHASNLIIPSVISSLVLYYAAYILCIYIDPLYRLSAAQVTATNSIIEITFFILVVVNALIGRYGSIASEDQLIAEMAKSKALLQQLQELDRQKTLFFQNISHEFRTPLTLIIGPLETILSEKFGRMEQSLKEQLVIMQQNAGRLLGLINQLLDISKVDAKKMPLKLIRGNLSALASDITASFKHYADKLNINLTFSDDARNVEIFYDPQMMEKVLVNLISNALKFTPDGGWVTLQISETKDGEYALISVKDSGIGISTNDLPHIFNRFHQADATMTRNHEGTGIGLSLVQEFIKLHGGTITVDSTINKGSEFKVMLPKHDAPMQEYELTDEQASEMPDENMYYYKKAFLKDHKPLGGLDMGGRYREGAVTVLIIDDNKDMRDYIRQVVKDDYQTVEAANGEEGLKKAEERIPDIIISDVMMPKMDGYELCRRVKASTLLKNIPVILVTARASEEMTIEGLESGAYDYITKPFAPKILSAKISGILHRLEAQKNERQIDSLTGLLNREAWEKKARNENERHRRYGNMFSIAFIDLDNFKEVNDTYGHQAGDIVLKTISSLIAANLRTSDFAGRFGGEEFTIYFPETSSRDAADSIQRILSLFRNRNIGDMKITCAFSAGVVEMNPDQELSIQEYMALADTAMYEAKKMGKGRVVIYKDSST
jgi:diguanylate cyclase (GGDEF)-like protein